MIVILYCESYKGEIVIQVEGQFCLHHKFGVEQTVFLFARDKYWKFIALKNKQLALWTVAEHVARRILLKRFYADT